MGIYYGSTIIYGFKASEISEDNIRHLYSSGYDYPTTEEILRDFIGYGNKLKVIRPNAHGSELYIGVEAVETESDKGGGQNEKFGLQSLKEAKNNFENSGKASKIREETEAHLKPGFHLLNTAG